MHRGNNQNSSPVYCGGKHSRSDGVKDKVFHALVNPRIPLSDRQEKFHLLVSALWKDKNNRTVYVEDEHTVFYTKHKNSKSHVYILTEN